MGATHVREFPFTSGGTHIPITVSTLDAEFEILPIDEPLLVKIDVQGFEDRVISGGRSTLGRAAVVIVESSFEHLYDGQVLFDEINDAMRRIGFCYRGNMAQLRSPDDGRVLQCDAIFVRCA